MVGGVDKYTLQGTVHLSVCPNNRETPVQRATLTFTFTQPHNISSLHYHDHRRRARGVGRQARELFESDDPAAGTLTYAFSTKLLADYNYTANVNLTLTGTKKMKHMNGVVCSRCALSMCVRSSSCLHMK